MRLSPTDLRAVLQSTELLTSDLEPESMPARTDLAVRSLIDTDTVSFEGFGCDNEYHGPLWYTPAGCVSEDRLRVLAENVQEHVLLADVLVARRRRGVRVSDYLTLTEFRKTYLYNEFFRFLKTDRQLTVGLEVSKDLTVALSLCRFGKDFSERDRTALELLTPHLEAAFRSAQFVTEMKRRPVGGAPAHPFQIHLVRVAHDFSSYEDDPSLRILLAKYFGETTAGLPDGLSRYVRHYWEEHAADDYHLPPPTLYCERADGTLRVRLRILSTTRQIVLLIDETASHLPMRPNPAVTGREQEVLSWVALGKTDGEIAELLAISTRTVQKHLQNIYQKLGVETRTAAMAKFLEIS